MSRPNISFPSPPTRPSLRTTRWPCDSLAGHSWTTPDTKPFRGPTADLVAGLSRGTVEGGFAVETVPGKDGVDSALGLAGPPLGLADLPEEEGLVTNGPLGPVVLEAGLLLSDLTDSRSSSDISP
mmetsp:Transcript_0/g.3  ORF Transcript_0/g.3 Transcript_0/m.3 type:complete len:125 (+) Transcript_0:2409-2783(+)